MLKNNKEFFDEELSGKDKTVKKLLVEYWEEIKDKNVISELDYEEFSNLLLRPKFIKDFNFKDRLEYINIGFMIWITSKNRESNINLKIIDNSTRVEVKPFKKYIEMSKSNSNKDHFYHVIAEHKFDRMTGKLMNVIEMLTLDEQKQIATKSVIKDYIYDCRNDCDAIRDDIFHELLKDGLPTEEHIYI